MGRGGEHSLPWTARQRRAIAVIMLGVLGWGAYRYLRNPSRIENPQEGPGLRAGELAGRVDPNTASWPELAALPVVGKGLAQRIVEERERFGREHPGAVAFATLEDLGRVKGIGPATIESIGPYLSFPAPPAGPASRPASDR